MHIKKLWYKNGNDLYVGSSIDYTYTERERIPQKWVHNFQIACLGLVVASYRQANKTGRDGIFVKNDSDDELIQYKERENKL